MQHVFSVSTPRNFGGVGRSAAYDVEPPVLISPNSTPTGSGFSSGANGGGGLVDVVNNFYWTYSKLRDSRIETPTIVLKEKRLKANALISQLKYSFGVAKSNVTAAFNNLGSDNPITKFLNSSGITGAAQGASQWTADLLSQLSYLQDNNNVYSENPYLLPYKNLYITEPTGWEYYLPYFDNYNNSQLNSFTTDAPGGNPFLGILKEAAGLATDVAEITSLIAAPKFANAAQITFVERAKFYSYGSEGEEFSFSFPLINTGSCTFEDVVRNWEFLFLLMYNNKPARKNVSIIDPPVIYQVEIPGVKFLPFCYISSMNIQFRGSRRALSFDFPSNNQLNVETGSLGNLGETLGNVVGFNATVNQPRKINTIVPDAYVVTITVKSLLPETKNFMYSVLTKSPIVTTSTTGTTGPDINNPFVDTATQNTNAGARNPLDTRLPAPGLPNTGR